MIPYGRQSISQADINAVIEVLKSDYLTQGPAVPAFESALSKYTSAKFAVAMNSATSALHVACLALGVSKGDIVWTTPITFVASANCALYCGADIDFIDIDPNTYNVSISLLRSKLENARSSGKLPKVFIPVHLAGQSCDMKSIHDLCQKFGVKIIEDASHAIGGTYLNKKVGSCEFSDVTIFSFHPVKIITSAEGGAAMTNDKSLAKKMMLLRSHGITRDQTEMTTESHGPWYYQQIERGFNYRMTDLQAALGFSQLSRIEEFVAKRNTLAQKYNQLLESLPVTLPRAISDSLSAFHLYIIRLNLKQLTKSHRVIFNELRNAGIGVNLHYIPVHTQPYYQRLKKWPSYPESEKYYSEAISLPLYSDLTDEQMNKVVTTLREVLK